MAKKKPVKKIKAKQKKTPAKVVRAVKASKPKAVKATKVATPVKTVKATKALAKDQSSSGRKKTASKTKTVFPEQKPNFFSQINLSESYTSLVLGAVVVLLVVIIGFLVIKPAREGSVSSTRTDVMTEERAREKKEKMSTPSATVAPQEQVGEKITGKTYTVQEGDSISDIAQRAYNDEEKWVVIAEANNLSSPDAIAAGMVLTIPR